MTPKQLSGGQKRKKRKWDEEIRKSQARDLYKFMKHNAEDEEVEVKEMEEQEHLHIEQEHVEEENFRAF